MPVDHRYLWNTPFVREHLRAGSLSEAAAFRYFLAIMVFDWLQFTAIVTTPTPIISLWYFTASWITFVITVAGLMYLYVCNDGSKGKQFLRRYFPLSVTVGWKFVAAMFAAIWFVEHVLAGSNPEIRGWSTTGVLALLNVAMFLRIGYHLRLLAVGSPLNTQSEAEPGSLISHALDRVPPGRSQICDQSFSSTERSATVNTAGPWRSNSTQLVSLV